LSCEWDGENMGIHLYLNIIGFRVMAVYG
jgi:hypothetical protein